MERQTEKKKEKENVVKTKVNPLRNEKIYVRRIHQNTGLPKNHVLSDGIADGAFTRLCVPVLQSSGVFKNVLTNDEKEYLEDALRLDYNALSVYNKSGENFWENYYVELTKEGIHLDLSNPTDYIKYKVLLANSDQIAPSVEERVNRPKTTYLYEMVREEDETRLENVKMDAKISSYKEFGKIEDDVDTLRVLAELLDGRPYSSKEKPTFFRARISALIDADPKRFYQYVTDPLLHTKVIIRRSCEIGKIAKRGDYYYLSSDGSPLCEAGQNPTLSVAAEYLNSPAHQDIKFLLESEVDKKR